MFRDCVPEWLRFPLLLVLPFVYQSSNPLWMNIAHEVMSDTGLRNEDVLMLGFTTIIGITCTFPLVFRYKFRFTTRRILLMASGGIVVCTLLADHITFLPLLVPICFLFGVCKLCGTFECMSSMMKIITPDMHLAPFLAVVFTAVFGGVELGGLFSTTVSFLYDWHFVSLGTIGVHLLVMLLALTLMQDFRFQPPVPLRGIDWTGMLLWGLMLLSATAVCVYGETLDWLHSTSIPLLLALSLVSLGLALWRMLRLGERSFISPRCFSYPHIGAILLLFLLSGVLLSTQNILQNILWSNVLHYHSMATVKLNWVILLGVALGCVMAMGCMKRWGMNARTVTALSFFLTLLYLAMMYALVAAEVPMAYFILPSLLGGMGHSMLFVALTVYVESSAPFEHRMQMLMVLGLVRTGIATPIGNALFARLFRSEMLLHHPLPLALQELYLLAILFCAATLIALCLYPLRPKTR